MLVHEYLRWRPKPTQPVPMDKFDNDLAERILRNYGTTKYHEYLSFFKEQPPENNLPKLQVFSESPEGTANDGLIDCIPLCMYAEKGEKDKAPEDVKEFEGDDYYDMLRMLLESVDRYFEESGQEHDIRSKRDKIVADYNASGDATSFYRRMERLESQSPSFRPVRRYHRVRR